MLQQRVPSRIQMLQFHTIPGFPSCLACGLRVCIAKISLVRHISIGCRRMCCLCGFESELRPGTVSLRTRWNLLSIRRLEAQNPNNSFTRNRQIIQQAGCNLSTRKMSSEGAAAHIVPHGLLRPALYPSSPRYFAPNVFNGFNEDSSKIIILNMKFPRAKKLGMIY